jgi:hypothetical protein
VRHRESGDLSVGPNFLDQRSRPGHHDCGFELALVETPYYPEERELGAAEIRCMGKEEDAYAVVPGSYRKILAFQGRAALRRRDRRLR